MILNLAHQTHRLAITSTRSEGKAQSSWMELYAPNFVGYLKFSHTKCSDWIVSNIATSYPNMSGNSARRKPKRPYSWLWLYPLFPSSDEWLRNVHLPIICFHKRKSWCVAALACPFTSRCHITEVNVCVHICVYCNICISFIININKNM